MARFVDAIPRILEREGGYVNDPDDPGGETKYGISKRAYPDLDIKALTLDTAGALYKQDYWNLFRGDEIEAQDIAARLLDLAVNQGVSYANGSLQRALNIFFGPGWGLQLDNVMGPITLRSVNLVASTDVKYIVHLLEYYQTERYVSLLNNVRHKFLRGWLNRIIEG